MARALPLIEMFTESKRECAALTLAQLPAMRKAFTLIELPVAVAIVEHFYG